MSSPILEIRALTKQFPTGFLKPPRDVLKGIDLEVREGEIFGWFGQNGAGKSTTNKIILGFMRQTSGHCMVMGRSNLDDASRSCVGYLPENPAYYEFLTGPELLAYASALHGIPTAVARERARKLLDRVGLGAESSKRIGHYSKGMRQRVGLAQALVNEPRFLILDEPFEGLDPLGRQMLKEIILEEKARGAAVFLCSHQLLDAEGLCDRAAILDQGRVVEVGSIAEMKARHPGLNLEQIFIRTIKGAGTAPRAVA
jgi:ABC-2 type transport system ATP-binding protein